MEAQTAGKDTARDRLRRLYRFMARHRFVAHRDELLALGFGGSQIDNWIRSGRLVRAFRSVYSYGRDLESRESVWRAAILAAGVSSALIGRSACQAWGIITTGPLIPDRIDVGIATGQAHRIRGVSPALSGTEVGVALRGFAANDLRTKSGIALVRPELALIDFAASSSPAEVRFAFLEACRLKLIRQANLIHLSRLLSGRRGAQKLRPLLGLWIPELHRTRSVLEGWFLLAWSEQALPMPKVNERVFGYEVDCHWPKQRLVLELDGDAFHSDPVQKQIDREKQRHLEFQGLTVIRLTYKEFATDPSGAVTKVAGYLHRQDRP